ncbi:MAG: hypothetical protein HC923_11065 [Myxococcales bacterium]|nr:hypothetical protein [Myxococcales bacterium]
MSVVWLGILVLTTASNCSKEREAVPEAILAAEWQGFALKDSPVILQLPREPDEKSPPGSEATQAFASVVEFVRQYELTEPSYAIAVTHLRYRADLPISLDQAVEGAIKKVEGRSDLLSFDREVSTMSWLGRDARQLLGTVQYATGEPRDLYMRALRDGNDLVQVTLTTSKDDPQAPLLWQRIVEMASAGT